MKLEKPKKTKIKWHGQDIIMPFKVPVYQDKTVKIKNRFTGEETEMPGYAASVYDTIIGAEMFEVYEDKTVKIKNRFTGEETEMPGYAASVYDTIIGAERFKAWDIVRAGLDWF